MKLAYPDILIYMKRAIVSGYFNPLHVGHLTMMENAKKMAGYLIVLVNNDIQQQLKKGKIIVPEQDRERIVAALKVVDETMLVVDTDKPVNETLKLVAAKYPEDELFFGNGGDRDSEKAIPETATCEELGIEMVFGLAPTLDSSSRINRELGVDA